MKQDTEIKKALAEFRLPTYEEIPDIGLYLDQVVKYINSYFVAFPEMNVTASMLTNYVKLKLVKRINKKTYVREQIALFFFIAMAKTVISMDHIRILIKQNEKDSFETQYKEFTHILHEALSSFQQKNTFPSQNEEQILAYIARAIAYKMYLERKLQTYQG
ncbi:MAG: DUF1836 domain-containing protein [Solobacterium sp.]|nr:DUF1836 domain-containing protein [Solobacterium sp.]